MLYLSDLSTGEFDLISQGVNAPERVDASLAIDALGETVYFYGGWDGNQWHNDLWALDLVERGWYQVLADKPVGWGPPPGAGSALLAEATNGRLTVMTTTNGGGDNEAIWRLDLLGEARWVPSAELETVEQ